jgi:uncharacterized membrane protein required for colicin V production
MLPDILRQINWVDVFVVILILRVGYVAWKTGLPVEFFKLLGTITAIYLPCHYYTKLADFFRANLFAGKAALEFLDFPVFLLLAILGYLVFKLLRSVFSRFIKAEAVANLNNWGGLILGAVRGILLTGLIIFMLVLSNLSYLKNSVNDSYLGNRLLKVVPATYSWLWNSITSKFMPGEKFNEAIQSL